MAGDKFYYEKDGDDFVLIHEMYGESFNRAEYYRGPEVAVGYTIDCFAPAGVKYTTHRHGSPESVDNWASYTSRALKDELATGGANSEASEQLLLSMLPLVISHSLWDINDLNRLIDTTGYLEVVLRKMGLTED